MSDHDSIVYLQEKLRDAENEAAKLRTRSLEELGIRDRMIAAQGEKIGELMERIRCLEAESARRRTTIREMEAELKKQTERVSELEDIIRNGQKNTAKLLNESDTEILALEQENARLREALEGIAHREGTHSMAAHNMIRRALNALQPGLMILGGGSCGTAIAREALDNLDKYKEQVVQNAVVAAVEAVTSPCEDYHPLEQARQESAVTSAEPKSQNQAETLSTVQVTQYDCTAPHSYCGHMRDDCVLVPREQAQQAEKPHHPCCGGDFSVPGDKCVCWNEQAQHAVAPPGVEPEPIDPRCCEECAKAAAWVKAQMQQAESADLLNPKGHAPDCPYEAPPGGVCNKCWRPVPKQAEPATTKTMTEEREYGPCAACGQSTHWRDDGGFWRCLFACATAKPVGDK